MMLKKKGFEPEKDKKGGDKYNQNLQVKIKRFKEIAYNSKLFAIAKRSTEEIELLMAELNKLKKRTFQFLSM